MRRGVRLVLSVALFIPSVASVLRPAAQPRPAVTHSHAAPAPVRRALSCLLSHRSVVLDLADLRLQPGDLASIRYYVGTIPGTESTPGEFYIAVYAPGGMRGWVLIAVPTGRGRFLPVGNGYRLRKLRHGWQADEGNGGLATYAAMSRFAAWLVQHRRSYQIRLTPHPEYCSGPME